MAQLGFRRVNKNFLGEEIANQLNQTKIIIKGENNCCKQKNILEYWNVNNHKSSECQKVKEIQYHKRTLNKKIVLQFHSD